MLEVPKGREKRRGLKGFGFELCCEIFWDETTEMGSGIIEANVDGLV